MTSYRQAIEFAAQAVVVALRYQDDQALEDMCALIDQAVGLGDSFESVLDDLRERVIILTQKATRH